MQIATYINEEYGIASLITQISRGYSVVLVDTDAEKILPNVQIFPLTMLDQAIEYAKKIANIKE
jgi:MinD superfamily P-loop ATPase